MLATGSPSANSVARCLSIETMMCSGPDGIGGVLSAAPSGLALGRSAAWARLDESLGAGWIVRRNGPGTAPPAFRSSHAAETSRGPAQQQRRNRYPGNQRSALHRPISLNPQRQHPPTIYLSFSNSPVQIRFIPRLLRRISGLAPRPLQQERQSPVRSGCWGMMRRPPKPTGSSHEIPPFGRQGPRPRPHEGHLGGRPDALSRRIFRSTRRASGRTCGTGSTISASTACSSPASRASSSRCRLPSASARWRSSVDEIGRQAPASSPHAPTRTWTW